MKIAILGTRGIPNNYGGFEQFAEFLSLGLLKKGHQVFVYNVHHHMYKESSWNGVQIIHKYDPEKIMGTSSQFIYDLNCIVDSRKRKFDIILNLGYTSSSVWGRLFPKKAILITNMDGLEWRRSKYSENVKRFLKYAEKLAVRHSDLLVADSMIIKDYLEDKYNVETNYIAYGAEMFNTPDSTVLHKLNLAPHKYNLLLARMEPENNIELILDGVQQSKSALPFLVISNYKNAFGQYLINKYKDNELIIFMDSLYDLQVLNNLRHYSNLYFHGHSVGGTNPSLLEAMACKCNIIAHDNIFNKAVLGEDAIYFKSSEDVTNLLNEKTRLIQEKSIVNNFTKIKSDYSWDKIILEYESFMYQALKNSIL